MSGAEPSTLRAPWRRRWVGRLAGFAFLLAVAGVGLPALLNGSTSEPAALTSVAPADGATVNAAPQRVALAFTGDFQPREAHVTVANAAGVTVSDGKLVVDGGAVSAPVVAAGEGVYLVVYHFRLDDGRTISGVTRYTVDPSAAEGPAALEQEASAGDVHSHVPPADPLNVVLTCVAAVLIVAMGVLLLRRPRIAEEHGGS